MSVPSDLQKKLTAPKNKIEIIKEFNNEIKNHTSAGNSDCWSEYFRKWMYGCRRFRE
jgi:hypothetical protein